MTIKKTKKHKRILISKNHMIKLEEIDNEPCHKITFPISSREVGRYYSSTEYYLCGQGQLDHEPLYIYEER